MVNKIIEIKSTCIKNNHKLIAKSRIEQLSYGFGSKSSQNWDQLRILLTPSKNPLCPDHHGLKANREQCLLAQQIIRLKQKLACIKDQLYVFNPSFAPQYGILFSGTFSVFLLYFPTPARTKLSTLKMKTANTQILGK